MPASALQATRAGQLLVDTTHPDAQTIIQALQKYARITAYTGRYVRLQMNRATLWSAAAQGLTSAALIDTLSSASHEPSDTVLLRGIETLMRRWGALRMHGTPQELWITCGAHASPHIRAFLHQHARATDNPDRFQIDPQDRGDIKHRCWHKGWPIDDQADVIDGKALVVQWNQQIQLRPYQQHAVTAATQAPDSVIALPPGSGKTYIGVAVICAVQQHTLIITPSRIAAQQWLQSIERASTVPTAETVSIYRRARPLTPITITTYQQLIADPSACEHADWGLIVYDEVHMLPAPVFRTTAQLQARRRLGLSATLIREDGRIGDVFSLVGPQRYTLPWRELERMGYLAPVQCLEVSVAQTAAERQAYLQAPTRQQGQIAAHCHAKISVAQRIAAAHPDAPTLIIGQYIGQLQDLADASGWAFVHGGTTHEQRAHLYADFREGRILRLIVSKVANQAVDLPNAQLLIQLSGSYGSRQEEAQRLGRILRPQAGKTGLFVSLVTKHTREVDDAWKRQQFLRTQGYTYTQMDEDAL